MLSSTLATLPNSLRFHTSRAEYLPLRPYFANPAFTAAAESPTLNSAR